MDGITRDVFDTHIRDRTSGEHLLVHTCIEITDECPGASKKDPAFLCLGEDIVVICRPGEDGLCSGVRVEFRLSQLEQEMKEEPHNIFAWTAWGLGFRTEVERLKALIEKYAYAAAPI